MNKNFWQLAPVGGVPFLLFFPYNPYQLHHQLTAHLSNFSSSNSSNRLSKQLTSSLSPNTSNIRNLHHLMKLNNRKLLLQNDDDDDTYRPIPTSSSLPKEFLLPTTSTSITNTSAVKEKHVSSLDISMALTMLILLIALFFMGFFSVYLRNCDEDSPGGIRRRQRQRRRRTAAAATATATATSSTTYNGRSHGVDPLIVKSLPLVAYEKKYEKEPFDCVVCLCEFEERETVKMIPHCRHVFHPECIDKWFSSHDSCPLCRSIQLLRLPSHKEEQNRSVNVIEERLVVEDVDTCVEEQRKGGDFWRIRRTSSWSSGFGERVCLQRSLSM